MNSNANPAKRLHTILTKAKPFQGLTINVWAAVFDITPDVSANDLPLEKQLEVLSCVQQTLKLVDEVEELIKNIQDINHERYLRPFPRIKEAFPKSLNHFWSEHRSFINKVTEGDLVVLEFCIDVISSFHPEKIVNENEIKEITVEISKLYEQIYSSDLEKPLKDLLLDLLEIMRSSVHEYRIRGIARLKEGIAEVLGKLILNKDLIQNSQREEVNSIKKLLNKFFSVYSFAADSIQMIEGVQKVLPLLPPIIDTLGKMK